jgi:hypothetical protein
MEYKTRDIVLQMSHEHIVQAISQYLYQNNLWPYDTAVVADIDLGIDLNEEGLVEMVLTLEDEVSH